MFEYFLKLKEKESTISQDELTDEKKVEFKNLQKENNNEPILFCTCRKCSTQNKNLLIPMYLTSHKDEYGNLRPHIKTKGKNNEEKHYKFCKHYNTNKKNGYKPAISIENGEENFHVKFKTDKDLIKNISEDYIKENLVKGNYKDSIIKNYMTFERFIEYQNMTYFRISQYKYNFIRDISLFNKKLYGYIINKYINNRTIKSLKESKGNFFYQTIKKINPKNSKYEIIDSNNWKFFIKKDIVEVAIENFKNRYNNLNLLNILEREDMFIVMFGFKKGKTYSNIGFMLVNKYGLFCESKNEAIIFNKVCEYVNLNNNFIFYKESEPENDYEGYENYIADGVLKNKKNKEKAIIEVFGRKETEYLQRKTNKEKSCRYTFFNFDIFNKLVIKENLIKLKKFLT